jgi:hypothetical protein
MLRFKKTIFAALFMLLGSLIYPPNASAQDVHAVVDLNEHCIIGGTSGGKWLEADAITPLIKGGERYRLYTLTKQVGTVTGSKPESYGEPCEDVMTMKFTPESKDAIAVGGDWDAQPRVPRLVGTNDPVYRQAVAGFLRRKGFVRPKINLTQVIRIDLDGDGTEEVIVSANQLAGGLGSADRGMAFRAQPGDYSLVFVRKLVQGKVQNIVLTEEYFPKKSSEPWGPPNKNEVAAVLDLNGDGRMEIILHGAYYEGSWSTVFRLDANNKFENVFGCGCGV